MSYEFTAFLAGERPTSHEAGDYLLEGALFDDTPEIVTADAPDGSFDRMELRYAADRSPMVLRRVTPEEAEPVRHEAIEAANAGDRTDIATAIERAGVALRWEVDRAELDEDAWFALHLWQAWVLGQSAGWLYAPGDGVFDAQLRRCCPAT